MYHLAFFSAFFSNYYEKFTYADVITITKIFLQLFALQLLCTILSKILTFFFQNLIKMLTLSRGEYKNY